MNNLEKKFGKDHWSTLMFLETQIVDKAFPIDLRRLRINSIKRPFGNGCPFPWSDSNGTRFKDGSINANHDDIDVIDELEEAGYIENCGTVINIYPKLKDKGWKVCEALRKHKGSGGSFKTFDLSMAGILLVTGIETVNTDFAKQNNSSTVSVLSHTRHDKRYETPFEDDGAYADDRD